MKHFTIFSDGSYVEITEHGSCIVVGAQALDEQDRRTQAEADRAESADD